MFEKSREKYKDDENKLLIAKTIDKYEFCKSKNKITYTDFLNISQISIIKKFLKEENIENYVFFGGKEDADRSILIFYPEKILSKQMLEKNYEKILNIIRIKLPNGIKYEHREILSGVMKLGIKREKFGDIIITDNGADIISLLETSKILIDGLNELTRFRKSEITIDNINDLKNIKTEFEEVKFIVTSIRLDNFVSEIAKTSRANASEIIKSGKVFINSLVEFKDSKKINKGDIITVRGCGKFIFEDIERTTKSGRLLINMKKYK